MTSTRCNFRHSRMLLFLLPLFPILVQAQDRAELVEVACWFQSHDSMPDSQCYRMHVPENHARSNSNMISFPVAVFRSAAKFWKQSPVLHLGGGGPGGPMYLDEDLSMRYFWEQHDEISTAQRRDLIVIDPRGTGLAEPLLACHAFLENEAGRLERNLSMSEEWREIEADYRTCIDDYAARGVDFSGYNSLSIAQDIELLRQAMGVESWNLIGVSYGTVYAQMLAREFPESIDAMILDSATFPNLKPAQNWIRNQSAPFDALLNYCRINDFCDSPPADFESRFWNLYRKLNRDPIVIVQTHPYENHPIKIVLNGERLLGILLQGTYNTQIYYDLPAILNELEKGHSKRLQPYLEDTLYYVFDHHWGDISAEAHYCFDTRPWVDMEDVESEIAKLPEGWVKSSLELGLKAENHCPRMGIESGYTPMAGGVQIDVPTLFLHGKFDSVTFLDDVVEQRKFFPQSHLIEFDQAHSVLSYEACAEIIAGKFVKNPSRNQSDLDCD